MRKEIDYRFNKDGQIIRIENKLSTPLSKELPEEPTEEIHSFKFSKYFLSVFEVIDFICYFAMYIQMMVLLVKLIVPFSFLSVTPWTVPVLGISSTIKQFFDIIVELNILIPTFAYLCSWWCNFLLKKDESSDKTEIDFQGILFWLIFFIASKVMP